MKKTILITRPQDQAQKIIQHLKSEDFEVFVEPVFVVEKIDAPDLEAIKKLTQEKILTLILTSANAAEAALKSCEILALAKDIKIFAVGKKTAEAFLAHNFKNVRWAQNSAEDLQKLILSDVELAQQKKLGKVLYFCGEIVTLDFKQELEKQGFEVEKIISYKITRKENFSAEFLAQTKITRFDFVLLYSKNSADNFVDLCKKHNLLEYFSSAQILCLSQKIIVVLRDLGFTNLATFDAIPIIKNFYD